MIRLFLVFLVLALVSLVLSGCPIGPSSRIYKPVSDWEQNAFEKADRTICPDDVRENHALLDSVRVAWPSIILEATSRKSDTGLYYDFVLEHHYYDWIEDFSIQEEKIFLSPRGEGKFITSWAVKPDVETARLDSMIGNMMIVYGRPISINDGVVEVRAYYLREIEKRWFATDIWEYGRDGDSLKILRIPGPK